MQNFRLSLLKVQRDFLLYVAFSFSIYRRIFAFKLCRLITPAYTVHARAHLHYCNFRVRTECLLNAMKRTYIHPYLSSKMSNENEDMREVKLERSTYIFASILCFHIHLKTTFH